MEQKNFSNHIKLNNTRIDDSFWNGIISLVTDEVIPYQYEALNDRIPNAPKSYCIENFKKAAAVVKKQRNGIMPETYPEDRWEYKEGEVPDGSFHGWVFQDSDIYKWIEAVGYSLTIKPDKELEQKADECIDLICSAQLDNGYLDTLYIINDISKAFTNLRDKHELYCFGHLTEAAISYFNATGKDKLLNTAIRFADLICATFNENGKRGYAGHEICEMALIKLYKVTDCRRYLEAAEFFINERGKKPYYFDAEQGISREGEYYHYNQAHRPVRRQDEAVGHAVRGTYLYSGMSSAAKELGDDGLYEACKTLWDNIVQKKMYITGGIGATVDGEAFSFNYDLPNDLAYSETCASIGLIFFARRMLEAEPKSEYADVMERALCNTVLAGMSEDGKSFFYVNPLEVLPEASRKDSRKRHIKPIRQKWFGCACCPPNIARLITSLPEYCVTENSENVYFHLYIGGEYKTECADITVTSDCFESGAVSFDIKCNKPFKLALRLPEWSGSISIPYPHSAKSGYAYIDVERDCKLDIKFSLETRVIKCSNRVRANIGKAAVMRGPFVYCLEETDNGADLQMLSLNPNTRIEKDGEFLIADGYREAPDTLLYSSFRETDKKPVKLKLIPYYRWGNRGENEMSVYIRI